MFSDMTKNLPCPVCLNHGLYYSQVETSEAWQHPIVFRLDDIDKLRDGVISDILVFICDSCDAEVRYTFKEVELQARKRLTEILLTQIAKGDMPDPGVARKIDRTLIYCGKCGGFDGKGSCPGYIFDGCELKRLPYGF